MASSNGMYACVRQKDGRVDCPGRCACVDVPGDREPLRFLHAARIVAPTGASTQRLTWRTRVDFCARDLPVTAFAAFLDRAFPDQVFVPAGKVYASISRRIDGATLAEVAVAIGLVAAGRY